MNHSLVHILSKLLLDTFKEMIFTFNKSFVPIGKTKQYTPIAVIWHEAISGRKKKDFGTFYNF